MRCPRCAVEAPLFRTVQGDRCAGCVQKIIADGRTFDGRKQRRRRKVRR